MKTTVAVFLFFLPNKSS